VGVRGREPLFSQRTVGNGGGLEKDLHSLGPNEVGIQGGMNNVNWARGQGSPCWWGGRKKREFHSQKLKNREPKGGIRRKDGKLNYLETKRKKHGPIKPQSDVKKRVLGKINGLGRVPRGGGELKENRSPAKRNPEEKEGSEANGSRRHRPEKEKCGLKQADQRHRSLLTKGVKQVRPVPIREKGRRRVVKENAIYFESTDLVKNLS